MKKIKIHLFLVLLLTTIPYTIWIIKEPAKGKDNISFSFVTDNTFYNKNELKDIIKKNKIKSNKYSSTPYIYYESKANKYSKKTEYQYNKTSLISYYNIEEDELRFIWEYSEDNAQDLLQNTIKQLSLVKLYNDSELYTYENWDCIDSDYIDVFWVEDNYSFIANIPKKLVLNNKQLIYDFCKSKKEQFE